MRTITFTILCVIAAASMFVAGLLYQKIGEEQRGHAQAVYTQQAIDDLRSYQIETYNDSTVIFDGDRHVATIAYDSTSAFDKAITNDNQ